MVVKIESDGTWIILEWDNKHRAVGSTSRLLAGYSGRIIRMFKDLSIVFENWKAIPTDKKTKFYDAKIKVSLINNYIFL